jgi:hypothetical protein
MSRIGKIILGSLLTVIGLAVAFVIALYWTFAHVDHDKDLDQQVQLSNSAFLKVHGEESPGPDTGYGWDISYRPSTDQLSNDQSSNDQSKWEKAGNWWSGSGDTLACPVGKLVVLVRPDGSLIFVRTEAGRWTTFYMEIPGPSPFSKNEEISPNSTSLEVAEIETIRSRMSLTPGDGALRPYMGQFIPRRLELWVDYLTPEKRRFRVRYKLYQDGEKFRLLDLEEQPFDKSRPFFEQFVPDTPVDPVCDKIEFSRRADNLDHGHATALMIQSKIDPKHLSSIESVEGWRVRDSGSDHPERIYLVLHGERRLIPSMETYKNLFGASDLTAVRDVGKSFDEIPEGDPISADAAVWRFPDTKLYFFDNGEYHWMNAAVAREYGFDSAPVRHGEFYFLKDHTGDSLGPL